MNRTRDTQRNKLETILYGHITQRTRPPKIGKLQQAPKCTDTDTLISIGAIPIRKFVIFEKRQYGDTFYYLENNTNKYVIN